VNIASRIAPFLAKFFDNKMPDLKLRFGGVATIPVRAAGLTIAAQKSETIRTAFEEREFGKAVRLIMEVADAVNEEIDEFKPWLLAKEAPSNAEATAKLAQVCASSIASFKVLTLFLKPILPVLATEAEKYLQCGELTWAQFSLPLDLKGFLPTELFPAGHRFEVFSPLLTRVDPKQIDALIAATKETSMTTTQPTPPIAGEETRGSTISIDDFSKIDLRIAKIANAEHVEGADKLLKLTLDVGALGTRQVFAGIKSAYDPAQLIGRLTVMVANLAPRKMKFGMSEGMVLAASDADNKTAGLYILAPDSGAQPGMRVK
jgi:methionyl-tRNA synthetase